MLNLLGKRGRWKKSSSAIHTLVLLPTTAQSLASALLHVPATYFSHQSGRYNIIKIQLAYHVLVNDKHKQTSIIQQLNDVQHY